ERAPAAQMLPWNQHLKSGFLEHCRCGLRSFWEEVIVERVCPQNHSLICTRMSPWATFTEPPPKSLRRKFRNLALHRHSCCNPGQMAQSRSLCHQVHHPWPDRSQSRPLIHQPECIRISRTQTAFPVMRQELRLVCSDVHVHRAIAFAPFAGKTQVERFLYVFIPPAVGYDISVQHFPEVVGAATRCVPLFVRHHEAWTHCVIFRTLAFLPSA